MHHLPLKDAGALAPLFEGLEDSMVLAYLEGSMGEGYADRMPGPTAGLIVSSEYCFFGGDAGTPGARELVENLFSCTDWDEVTVITREGDMAWRDLLLSVKKNHPVEVPRFGIVQKDYDFDLEHLKEMASRVPPELRLVPFDLEIYGQAMAEHWSQPFCDAFASGEDFLKRGFGFAVTDQGRLVAGASTMTVYKGGEETQVATREEYRGRGLALAAAAALIAECLRRGMRPCWDAANETSLHMALRLGYAYRGVYSTVQLSRHGGIRPGKYRHYKGGEYQVLFLATHSETLEEMVVYRALYGEHGVWVRPAEMWNETVNTESGKVPRFAYLGEADDRD